MGVAQRTPASAGGEWLSGSRWMCDDDAGLGPSTGGRRGACWSERALSVVVWKSASKGRAPGVSAAERSGPGPRSSRNGGSPYSVAQNRRRFSAGPRAARYRRRPRVRRVGRTGVGRASGAALRLAGGTRRQPVRHLAHGGLGRYRGRPADGTDPAPLAELRFERCQDDLGGRSGCGSPRRPRRPTPTPATDQ